MRRLFVGQPVKQQRHRYAQNTKLKHRRAPTGNAAAPTSVSGAEKKTGACANSKEAEGFASGFRIDSSDQRGRSRVKGASSDAGNDQERNCLAVVSRERKADETGGVDDQSDGQQLSLAESIRQ